MFCKDITFNDKYSVIINTENKVFWCGGAFNDKLYVEIVFKLNDKNVIVSKVCIDSSLDGGNSTLYILIDGAIYKVSQTDFTNIDRIFDITYDPLQINGSDDVEVNPIPVITKLSICDGNLAALSDIGDIYVWGRFGYGFGFTVLSPNISIVPTLIIPNPNIKFIDVIAGYNYSLALTTDGKIYSVGFIMDDSEAIIKGAIGNTDVLQNKSNYFYPITTNGETQGLLPDNLRATKIALGHYNFLAISGAEACFNEGTKILCLNSQITEELQEKYCNVEDLKVGDFVKSYLHGYRKVNKILTGSFGNNPKDEGVSNCMYKMVKTNDNGLIEDLILTRNHGILVEKLSENEEKAVDKNNLPIIDGLLSIITADSDKFEKVMDNNMYNYYHFSLETDGDNDRRFGVYANGLLVETPSINMMNNALNIKPLDF